MNKLNFLVLAAGIAAGAQCAETMSASVTAGMDRTTSLLWSTVTSDAVPLWWEYPQGADKAVLIVKGLEREMRREFLAANGETEFLWNVPAAPDAGREEVYELRLEFYAGDAVMEGETLVAGGIGRVCGTGMGSEISVLDSGSSDTVWTRAFPPRAVVPLLDERTESVAVNGEQVAIGFLPGWFGFPVRCSETKEVVLAAGGESLLYNVRGAFGGTVVVVR